MGQSIFLVMSLLWGLHSRDQDSTTMRSMGQQHKVLLPDVRNTTYPTTPLVTTIRLLRMTHRPRPDAPGLVPSPPQTVLTKACFNFKRRR